MKRRAKARSTKRRGGDVSSRGPDLTRGDEPRSSAQGGSTGSKKTGRLGSPARPKEANDPAGDPPTTKERTRSSPKARSGRKQKASATGAIAARPRTVKPKAASKPKTAKPGAVRPKAAKPAKRPSRHPEAVRSRRRRREEIGIRDQLAHERSERARVAREEARRKRRPGPPDERALAVGWLEDIRNVVAGVFRCSLDLTQGVRSNAPDQAGESEESRRQRENMRSPWLVVGRFDPQEPIGYVELAEALSRVSDDLVLEAAIHPQRLSQIRIVYNDPRSTRGEGDSIVSKIAAWQFVLSDLVGEMVGAGRGDEDALATRYAETGIPMFYVYFGSQIVRYVDRSPWQRVMMR